MKLVKGELMKPPPVATHLLTCVGWALLSISLAQGAEPTAASTSVADPEITAFIGKIRAVDNHSHANTVDPTDSDQDALPLETIFPFEVPVRIRPDSPDWLAAYKALY